MKNKPGTHWPVHPMAQLFPAKTPEERTEMKSDMTKRLANGLNPIEIPILKYQDMILDGRTRDEIWLELADEGAGGGYFKNIMPPTEKFSPEKDGTLGAWMRAKSRNLIVRQTPADQRAAIFLTAVDTYPELKAVLDHIKEENAQRQKEGKPLGAGVQRGSTAEQIADLAGVGPTTVKQAQKLQKEAPDKFDEVAQGKTTTKKALKEAKRGKTNATDKSVNGTRPKIADLLGIVHRGLAAATEAEGLDLKTDAVFFRVNGYRVKVMCKIL